MLTLSWTDINVTLGRKLRFYSCLCFNCAYILYLLFYFYSTASSRVFDQVPSAPMFLTVFSNASLNKLFPVGLIKLFKWFVQNKQSPIQVFLTLTLESKASQVLRKLKAWIWDMNTLHLRRGSQRLRMQWHPPTRLPPSPIRFLCCTLSPSPTT